MHRDVQNLTLRRNKNIQYSFPRYEDFDFKHLKRGAYILDLPFNFARALLYE
jgi:hypothetical protein